MSFKVRSINMATFRGAMRDLIDDLAAGGPPKVLSRNNKPMAVIISMKDYNQLLDIWEDSILAKNAKMAEKEPDIDFRFFRD